MKKSNLLTTLAVSLISTISFADQKTCYDYYMQNVSPAYFRSEQKIAMGRKAGGITGAIAGAAIGGLLLGGVYKSLNAKYPTATGMNLAIGVIAQTAGIALGGAAGGAVGSAAGEAVVVFEESGDVRTALSTSMRSYTSFIKELDEDVVYHTADPGQTGESLRNYASAVAKRHVKNFNSGYDIQENQRQLSLAVQAVASVLSETPEVCAGANAKVVNGKIENAVAAKLAQLF
jgi:hypothetical protein